MIIIGAGSAGIETSSILIKNNYKKEVYFFDKNINTPKLVNGIKVINNENDLILQLSLCKNFCVAIGNNRIRSKVFWEILKLGGVPANIISLQTTITDTFSENGTIIQPGVVVSYGFSLGNSCMIHANSVIGHKVEIGDFVHISPLAHLIGPLSIGSYTFIGSSSIIFPNIKIGEHCVIPAGSVVKRDVEDYEVFC